MAELLSELTDDYDPHPELFDCADRTLEALAAGEDPAAAVMRFEMTTLGLLGYLPSLEQCVECGGKVEASPRVAFALLDGGVMCRQCRGGKRKVISLSSLGLETMRRFATEENETWQSAGIESSVRGELRAVLNQYFDHLLGHQL